MAQYTGVLCHITSLPNGLSDAEKFIDFIVDYGASVWQVLPITPPDEHGSPYASPSAFAAWDSLGKSETLDMKEESYWLEDWLLFEALKVKFDGKPWYEWPVEYRDRNPSALAEIHTNATSQARFMGRWKEVREYAESREVSLIGDLPMYVTHDSCDVWSNRELFLLNPKGQVELVAGVPPDYFSKKGQRWGNVLYDWKAHQKEQFLWWKARIRRMLDLFDYVRIDHFRGFHSAWAIPSYHKTARKGHWIEGPKDKIIEAIIEAAEGKVDRILAEDLGIIPKEVVELRKKYSIHGMSILQFGFSEPSEENPHHPLNIAPDTIVYTGTHDNQTTKGWWNDQSKRGKSQISKFFELDEEPVWELIYIALKSKAKAVIIPAQDIMELGDEARMNKPGTTNDNWNWKLSSYQNLERGLAKLATFRNKIDTR